MSGETNEYYCRRCRNLVFCDPDDEDDNDYITARRTEGLCRPCYEARKKKQEGKDNATN